jgi:hypothetical protein
MRLACTTWKGWTHLLLIAVFWLMRAGLYLQLFPAANTNIFEGYLIKAYNV